MKIRKPSNLTNRIALALASLAIMFVGHIGQASAQAIGPDPRNSRAAFNLSDFESINLETGKFTFTVPLALLGGRGLTNDLKLSIEQSWRQSIVNSVMSTHPDPYAFNWIQASGSGFVFGNSSISGTHQVSNCSNETYEFANSTEYTVNFTTFGGHSILFRSEMFDGAPRTWSGNTCWGEEQSIGTVFIAWDGSGAKFISDSPIVIGNNPLSDSTPLTGVVKLADGTTYRVEGGLIAWIQDRNGNRMEVQSVPAGGYPYPAVSTLASVTDSLGRTVTVSGNWPSPGQTKIVSYKGFGGTTRQASVVYDNLGDILKPGQTLQSAGQLFPGLGTNHTFDETLVKQVVMPNGGQYSFLYNSYAELARVTLPTGGAIEYDYETLGGLSLTRRLTERREYKDGTNLTSRTVYAYSYDTGWPPGAETWTVVKIYDAAWNVKSITKTYFLTSYGGEYSFYFAELRGAGIGGRVFKVEYYDTDGTTVLRKVEHTYAARAQTSWTVAGLGNISKDYRLTETKTTLSDTNQVSKVTYGYDSSAALNRQNDVYEYDWGIGAAGSLIRRTHTDYENSPNYVNSSVSLLSLPTETWVSSDVGGSAVVSRTRFEYDHYNQPPNPSDSNHAALVPRSNVTRHNTASYGTGFAYRGNVTAVTTYSNAQAQTGVVTTYSQYDTLGNVVKVIDAKGNASTVEYSDRFGWPDAEARSNSAPSSLNGQSTFAFATSTTNAAGTTYSQFDYFTGAAVDGEDIIGNVSTTFYNDPLDRPTQMISANNRPLFRKQTVVVYDDVNRMVRVTADSKAFGDNFIKGETFYNGLGRTIEARSYENASEYIKTLTEYDSLGRAYKTSTPHRPYLNEQPEWTTSTFDALGRVFQVKTPDNAIVSRTYSGATTTVTDQAGRKRRGVSDAVGRLLKVIEDPDGLNYETNYTYDVLGRLRKTAQTEGAVTQNRYFMYDDLGRLVRAKQTEQGVNASLNVADPITGNTGWSVRYQYDANGNIVSTTDANNRTITGIYDNLNRLTFRDYSDSTPDVTFTFDDVSVANSKGQLTAVETGISSTFYTAFDELGRIKSSRQTTNGTDYNFPDYTYDFSGALVSQTYPSGRVVEIETDNIGRLSKVSSQTTNQVERIYLSNLAYTSFGAVKHARLGNGRWESAQFDIKTLQIEEMRLGASASSASLFKIEYDFSTTDNNGSLKQQKITVPGAANAIIQNYTYDMLNRLQSATETVNSLVSWKQTFAYDRFGNRRFDAANTTTLPQNNGVYNPNVDPQTNKFLVAEGYNYDAEGNLVGNPESQLFSYSADNRMTQVQNTATQTIVDLVYDGSGKRVRKVVGSDETIFVYDAFDKMVAEYSTVIETRPKTISYLTTDDLGSPRVITDQFGQVVARHDYMPFGEEVLVAAGGRTPQQGYGGNDGVKRKFTGYERDAESGLDYAQARYFKAGHGRFTSVDPLAASANVKNPQTLNRYIYALNSPYKFTDPLGLSARCGPGCVTASEYDGIQDLIDEEDQKKKTESKNKRREFNRAFARYLFERTSQGYLDDSGMYTASMYDVTSRRVVAQTVTLTFSVSEMMLTVNRNLHIEVTVQSGSGRRRTVTKTNHIETEVFQIGGSSGKGDCMNNADCATDSEKHENLGPIPIGSYVLNKNEIAMLNTGAKSYGRSAATTFRSLTGIPVGFDWGSFRVPLTPTSAMHRSGFYLHGGRFPGSLGCIDVGGDVSGNEQTEKLLNLIRSSSFNTISLTVTR